MEPISLVWPKVDRWCTHTAASDEISVTVCTRTSAYGVPFWGLHTCVWGYCSVNNAVP